MSSQSPDLHPHRRFSRRVANYARHRPGYPPGLLSILEAAIGLTPAFVIADVGAGTGIFSRILLDYGCTVYAVEPNPEMRAAAGAALAAYAGFHNVAGDASNMALPPASVDVVTAAQAFHWFDLEGARREFGRVLRPRGYVVLIYNSWRDVEDPFLVAYDGLVRRFDPERGQRMATPQSDRERLDAFFGPGNYAQAVLPNPHWYDWEMLCGRMLSSSYTPLPDHPDHANLLASLRALFDTHARDGQVRFPYATRLYWGRPLLRDLG